VAAKALALALGMATETGMAMEIDLPPARQRDAKSVNSAARKRERKSKWI
jgi:hypothetical protein